MATPELYTRNTLAMWSSLAPWASVTPGTAPGWSVVGIPAQATTRVIVGWPPPASAVPVTALLAGHRGPGRVVVEDAAGDLLLPRLAGVTVDRYPVMARPAAGTGSGWSG